MGIKHIHRKIIMTHTQTTCRNRIDPHASKTGACPVEVGALVPVFESSATELKQKQKLLKSKSTMQMVTFSLRTLNRIGQLPELTVFAIDLNIDIICVQEHRNLHSEDIKYHDIGNGWTFLSASAWKNSVNAAIRGVGMNIGPQTQKSITSRKYNWGWW